MMFIQTPIVKLACILLLLSPVKASEQTTKTRSRDLVSTVRQQFNPGAHDYGVDVQMEAEGLINATLLSVYFWICIASLGAASISALWLAQMYQRQQRRELIAARYLAWYHNQFVLVRQRPPRSPSNHNQGSVDQPSSLSSVQEVAQSQPDLVSDNTRLRQQIADHEALQKTLRDQINMLTRKLHDEKQRNKTIKT